MQMFESCGSFLFLNSTSLSPASLGHYGALEIYPRGTLITDLIGRSSKTHSHMEPHFISVSNLVTTRAILNISTLNSTTIYSVGLTPRTVSLGLQCTGAVPLGRVCLSSI